MAERIYNEFYDPFFRSPDHVYGPTSVVYNYDYQYPDAEDDATWIVDEAAYSTSYRRSTLEEHGYEQIYHEIANGTPDFHFMKLFDMSAITSPGVYTSVFRMWSNYTELSGDMFAASLEPVNAWPANTERLSGVQQVRYKSQNLFEVYVSYNVTVQMLQSPVTPSFYLELVGLGLDSYLGKQFYICMAATYPGDYVPAYPWISLKSTSLDELGVIAFDPGNNDFPVTDTAPRASQQYSNIQLGFYRENTNGRNIMYNYQNLRNQSQAGVGFMGSTLAEDTPYLFMFTAHNVSNELVGIGGSETGIQNTQLVREGVNRYVHSSYPISGTAARPYISLKNRDSNQFGTNFGVSDLFFTSSVDYTGQAFDGDTPPFYYKGELVIPMWEGERWNSRSFIELGSGIDGEQTIRWNESEDSEYETGVDRGVIFLSNSAAPWNGLVSVTDSFDDSEETPLYEDGEIRYISSIRRNSGLTVESYGIPKELELAMGKKEIVPGLRVWGGPPTTFGLAYQTLKRRPDGTIIGRKLHIVYNCKGRPDELVAQTHDDSNDLDPVSLTLFATVPRDTVFMSSPKIDISADMVGDPIYYDLLELILFGSSYQTPRLLLPSEIADVLEGNFQEYITTGTTDSEDDDI